MCTRAVSTLAHVFEAAGLASVALASNREQARRISPPRALFCDFPLGRPLGAPRDPALQRRVLEAAFALLEAPAGPLLVEFPEAIHDAADTPVACPVPPRDDAGAPPATAEARALRPAWERARVAHGGSQVGRVIDADAVPEALEACLRIAEGTPWREAGIPGDIAAVLMDIRCYYEEAAMALAEHVPAARSAEAWYYQRTEAGALMKRMVEQLVDSDPAFPYLYYLAPFSQQETIPLPGG